MAIVEKNSRQVPNETAITAQKNYNDILYCYLQVNSQLDKEKNYRYILKKDVRQAKLAEVLGYTRQTISKKMKHLLEAGLLIEHEKDYELVVLDKKGAFLIQVDTLRKMVNTFNERTITIYVYLANRYFANNSQGFSFSIAHLKEISGLSITTQSNNVIVTDILEILQKLGLIEYTLKKTSDKATYQLQSLKYSC